MLVLMFTKEKSLRHTPKYPKPAIFFFVLKKLPITILIAEIKNANAQIFTGLYRGGRLLFMKEWYIGVGNIHRSRQEKNEGLQFIIL